MLCPKHDLPLEAARPPGFDFVDLGAGVRWVTVCRFADTLAAQAPRIRLEAEGIPTFVDNERMGSRSMYHIATGGVRLRVPDSLAAEARIILSQTWSALAAEFDLETDDDEEHLEQATQTEPIHEPMSLRQSLLFLLAVGFPALILAYLLLRYWPDR